MLAWDILCLLNKCFFFVGYFAVHDRRKKRLQSFADLRALLHARLDQVFAVYLKICLAERYPYDIEGYCDGKEKFVKEMEEKALIWAAKNEYEYV